MKLLPLWLTVLAFLPGSFYWATQIEVYVRFGPVSVHAPWSGRDLEAGWQHADAPPSGFYASREFLIVAWKGETVIDKRGRRW